MFFDRVVATANRLEAYYRDELVRVRVKSENGWVDVQVGNIPLAKETVWQQASLPMARKRADAPINEPHYEKFEEAP